MSSTLKCPGCQTPLRVRDDMAGKKIKCPRCARHRHPGPRNRDARRGSLGREDHRRAADREIRREPAATRPCPACGERIALTARQCRHCQAKVEDEDEEDDEDRSIRPRSKYKACPRCGEVGAKRVMWTPWGSFYGPALFTHVRCPECGYAYNGKSGRSNLIPAIVFVTIPLLIILAIFGTLGWYIHHQGYF